MPEVLSALPRAKQVQLESLENAGKEPITPAAPAAPAVETPPATPVPGGANDEGTVTVSRSEYNELQAAAGKVHTLAAREETARLRADELTQRLTELERVVKDGGKPAAPTPAPAPSLTIEAPQFSEEEEKAFGDSRDFITKVVRAELAPLVQQINDLIGGLKTDITSTKEVTTTVAANLAKGKEKDFFRRVSEAVPSIKAIISHKNWADYLDEVDEMTGHTLEQLLAYNVKNERLDAVVRIYKNFAEKYLVKDNSVISGYAGGGKPNANSSGEEGNQTQVVKLKQSDRKKASEDYRKGRLTWEKLEEINKAFENADKLGNVDYNS